MTVGFTERLGGTFPLNNIKASIGLRKVVEADSFSDEGLEEARQARLDKVLKQANSSYNHAILKRYFGNIM
ncbi:uncharacterized protein RAG0_11216 [Rhynchosporium agropyri]|uniref:Uncharacterized protein n=3 Tax=Rhynchosporium TaxID=38037 RepID=A0A1E1M3A2_RHYSE|nr:uncharacterized protein RCO7_14167 [Rhynchosporium commune]CZT04971.1 uncharacterized protein RAG0_11216 [Rhynchosporium agropyri]CZT43055.1 uncharacterized protein RSE6_03034 [Rhynchosporium secalis]